MQLSVREAARLLGVQEQVLYRWIADHAIPCHKIQEQYRFHRDELLEWATRNRMTVRPDILAEQDGADARLSLAAALEVGGVHHELGGSDKSSVIRAMVDVLPLLRDGDRDYVYAVLMAREALGSTGIGGGIAIPHVRNPVVMPVDRPLVALCFPSRPVEFAAIDGKPVFALFAIICPQVRAHLHLLSRLAFFLRSEPFRALLERRAPPAEILRTVRELESQIAPAGPAAASEG